MTAKGSFKRGVDKGLKDGSENLIAETSWESCLAYRGRHPSASGAPRSISLFNQQHLQSISASSAHPAQLSLLAKMKPVVGVMQAWSWSVSPVSLHRALTSPSISQERYWAAANQPSAALWSRSLRSSSSQLSALSSNQTTTRWWAQRRTQKMDLQLQQQSFRQLLSTSYVPSMSSQCFKWPHNIPVEALTFPISISLSLFTSLRALLTGSPL